MGEDREAEYFFAPTKAKGKKGKKSHKEDAGKGSSIKHNMETFQLFEQLKLEAPLTTADIPPLLETLEKKLEEYKEKVKEWEVKRELIKKKLAEGEDIDELLGEAKKKDKDEKEEAAEEPDKEKKKEKKDDKKEEEEEEADES